MVETADGDARDRLHRVVAVARPDVVAFDLSIAAQVFGHRDEPERYAFTVCAERPGAVMSTTGFTINAPLALAALAEADTVIVPGYYPLHDPSPAVVAALRSAAERGRRIAPICIGAFARAATGLLDGRTATTHWQEADHFRARFPAVRLNPDVLYVDQGQLLTSAGLAAGIDLCLYLVGLDYGAAAAGRRRPGTHPQLGGDRDAPAADRRPPGPAGRPVPAHLRPPVPRPVPADPDARRLLEVTSLSVDEIAERCGLGSAATLRVHLARQSGTTPTAYRRSHRDIPPAA